MLLAIISDIHANEPAFAACLAAVERLGAARVVLLGDLVGYGPDPEAVTQRAAALVAQGAICLMGNHDAAAIAGGSGSMNDAAEAALVWTRPRLSQGSRRFLAQLPLTAQEDGLLFVHAEASRPADWLYVTDAAAAGRSLHAAEARVTFCGHVHRPQLYCLTATSRVVAHAPATGVVLPLLAQRRWLAVAGSAGQPRDGNPAASFLTYDTGTRELVYRRVPYDHEAVAARMRALCLPDSLAQRLLEGR